jgi:hypothetical protein
VIATAGVVVAYGGSSLVDVVGGGGRPPLLALLTAPLACVGTLSVGQVAQAIRPAFAGLDAGGYSRGRQ